MGTATDFEGNFLFYTQPGERSIQVSYVGYKVINRKVLISKGPQIVNFKLETKLLNEVQVVSDVARDRKLQLHFQQYL